MLDSIEFTKEEKNQFESFMRRHRHCQCTSTIGGKFSYILTPTGLGTLIKIKCNVCGKERDVTDSENW